MSYQSTVEQLYALGHELASTPSHKFDLAYVRTMLEALGHPERRFASVLIAGTNGKGSTAATLSSILRVAGYKTALYSSPHLVRINERVRVNGEAISDVEFGAMHERIERTAQELMRAGKLPWHPSFFEMLTVMAFEYFASVGVEIAVLEVGMGGRLDATNVVEPLISVIADIALDHQKYLGDTIPEIAQREDGNHPGERSCGDPSSASAGQRCDRARHFGEECARRERCAICSPGIARGGDLSGGTRSARAWTQSVSADGDGRRG